VTDEFDWAAYLLPKEKLAVTPYAYVVPPGDQIWLNYTTCLSTPSSSTGD
jgi:hypothetical protein